MKKIEMSSRVMVITEIKKKTKAAVFEDFKVGDLVKVSIDLGNPGRGRGLYASYVLVNNLTQGTKVSKSMSEASNMLYGNFKLEEADVWGEQLRSEQKS